MNLKINKQIFPDSNDMEKKMHLRNEKSFRVLQDNSRSCNAHVLRFPEGERKNAGLEII